MISVIVPVYNVEAYLDRCVESIVKQTYRDLEIILVDDGSKDHSPQMCDEWGKKDIRIKVIHKKNGGLSDARNTGLANAKGEYVGFIDSDDLIHPQMYELLYQEIISHQADVVECGYQKFSNDHEIPKEFQVVRDAIELTPEHALAELILERKIHQTTWNKLYRMNLLANIPFPVGKICEDEFWTYQIIGRAVKVVQFSSPLYFYYQRAESIIHTYSLKRLFGIDAFQERLKYVTEHFPSLYQIANKSYLSSCLYHSQMLYLFPQVDTDGSARESLHKRFQDGDVSSMLSISNWKYKIWYRLFLYFPTFTCKIRNLLKIGL